MVSRGAAAPVSRRGRGRNAPAPTPSLVSPAGGLAAFAAAVAPDGCPVSSVPSAALSAPEAVLPRLRPASERAQGRADGCAGERRRIGAVSTAATAVGGAVGPARVACASSSARRSRLVQPRAPSRTSWRCTRSRRTLRRRLAADWRRNGLRRTGGQHASPARSPARNARVDRR